MGHLPHATYNDADFVPRYDHLIRCFQLLQQKHESVCAFGIQITVEKITAALASYQGASLKTLVKEERSFGFRGPRRCDVYVVSYHPGYLQERLEVAAYLWQHNISTDLMYETGLLDSEYGDYLDICAREGILCVYFSYLFTSSMKAHVVTCTDLLSTLDHAPVGIFQRSR